MKELEGFGKRTFERLHPTFISCDEFVVKELEELSHACILTLMSCDELVVKELGALCERLLVRGS